jgi:hypothetical protein
MTLPGVTEGELGLWPGLIEKALRRNLIGELGCGFSHGGLESGSGGVDPCVVCMRVVSPDEPGCGAGQAQPT